LNEEPLEEVKPYSSNVSNSED